MNLGYYDAEGNLIRIEQATNGKIVAVRVNAGGNRKRFRGLGEYDTPAKAQRDLAAMAAKEGWRPHECDL